MNKLKAIAIIIFSLVCLSVGIYLTAQGLYTRSLLKPDNKNSQQSGSPQANQTTSTTKKYSNDTLKISITLDNSFHLAQGIDDKSITFQAVNYDESKINHSDPSAFEQTPPGVKFQINAQQKDPKYSLLEVAGQAMDGGENQPSITLKSVKVGGYNGLAYEKIENTEGTNTIFVEVKDRIYVIYIRGERNSYETNKNAVQKIIDSLTFL